MATRWTALIHAVAGTQTPLLDADTPSYSGLPVARSPAELRGADVAIIGVPFDRPATVGRLQSWEGYRRAPQVMRQNSMRFGGYVPEYDLDVFSRLRIVDYGDAAITEDVAASTEAVAAKVREATLAGCRVLTIGGFSPCSSYAAIKGLASATPGGQRIGTLSLDAHGDCLDREFGPTGSRAPGAATWEARMWDDLPAVDPTRHSEIGMRGPRNVAEMVAKYRTIGARLYTAAEVRARGIAPIAAEAVERAFTGTARTWLHFDMDVLDIGAVPDWGDEPLGLSAADCIHVVHEAGLRGLSALSFVYIPPIPAGCSIASYAIVYWLAGLVRGGHAGR
ncbi:MAG: arginase family protein [Alphaproteobacteria bacterium]|nr:arginase family protein [Alphaproteobacteria bacterium]